jgi:hypothetical protein
METTRAVSGGALREPEGEAPVEDLPVLLFCAHRGQVALLSAPIIVKSLWSLLGCVSHQRQRQRNVVVDMGKLRLQTAEHRMTRSQECVHPKVRMLHRQGGAHESTLVVQWMKAKMHVRGVHGE